MDQQHKLALDCGVAFVRNYYSKFASTPEEIIGMYASTSVLSHHAADESSKPIFGTASIKDFLRKVGSEKLERKFHLHSLECVPSVNHSVLVVAKGTILMRKGNQDFYHTFLLARDPSSQGYYIHNDLMQLGAEQAEAAAPVEHTTKRPASPPAKPTQEAKSPPRASPPRASPPAPPKEEPVEEVHEDPQPVDHTEIPAEPEAPAPAPAQADGALSWARVAGAKASAAPAAPPAAKPPAPKEQPKAASPRKEQPPPQPKSDAPVSWAGLVAGSVKADSLPAQRVIARGGAEAPKEEQKEEKKEVPSKPKGEKAGAKERGPPKDVAAAKDAAAAGAAGTVKKYQYAALYVSRLAPGMKEADIDTVFGPFGTIVGKTFRPGEFCFIDFDDHTAVKKALAASESDGVYYKSHKLGVQERKSPEQRAREREAGGGSKRGKSDRSD